MSESNLFISTRTEAQARAGVPLVAPAPAAPAMPEHICFDCFGSKTITLGGGEWPCPHCLPVQFEQSREETGLPWFFDALCGAGAVGFMVAGYILMDRAAQLCQAWGWCAG